jgi:antirestriction protein ArdC
MTGYHRTDEASHLENVMSNYQKITDQILAQMQTVGAGWMNPMQGGRAGMPRNAVTGRRYSGINVMLLGLTGQSWATYKQWQSIGAQVRKGEEGTSVVFYKALQVKDRDTGDDTTIPMMRSFTVFNADQVDGYEVEGIELSEAERIEGADQWVSNTGADIRHNNIGGAFYKPTADWIQVPHLESFKASEHSTQVENYYSTLFHELTHWTGHLSRCKRDLGNRFGSTDYAFEELVAEMGAAFQCALLGITNEPRADHAQYLNSWIKCLKSEPKAIFKAASLAEKAVQYIESLQSNEQQQAA